VNDCRRNQRACGHDILSHPQNEHQQPWHDPKDA
jgi:hypothetical protein